MLCTVSHEHNACAVSFIFRGVRRYRSRHIGKVLVACEERLAHNYFVEFILIFLNLCDNVIIFKAVHNVCGLNNYILNTVSNKSVKRLGYIVNLKIISFL